MSTTSASALDTRQATSTRSRSLARLAANPVLRDNVLLLGANLAAALFGYLVQSLLGKMLGLSAYADFASLIALSSILFIPTQVITTIVAKYVSGLSLDVPAQAAQLNGFIRRFSLTMLLVGAAVAGVFVACSGYITAFLRLGSPLGVFAIAAALLLSFLAPINVGVLQGLQRFAWCAVLIALPMALRLVLAITFAAAGFGADGAIIGVSLSILAAYVVSFYPLRAYLAGPHATRDSLRRLRGSSATTTITLLMVVALCNVDTILAKHYLSSEQAALYAALAIIGKIVLLVGNGIVMATFPKFVALHGRGKPAGRALLSALGGVLALSAAIEAVYLIAPTLVMRVLFGPAFTSVAGDLAAYGLAMLLLGLAQVFVYYFLALDKWWFLFSLLGCTSLQGVLFSMHHQTVGQLVQALVIANGSLVATLTTLVIVSRPIVLFAAGSVMPQGGRWRSANGDRR